MAPLISRFKLLTVQFIARKLRSALGQQAGTKNLLLNRYISVSWRPTYVLQIVFLQNLQASILTSLENIRYYTSISFKVHIYSD